MEPQKAEDSLGRLSMRHQQGIVALCCFCACARVILRVSLGTHVFLWVLPHALTPPLCAVWVTACSWYKCAHTHTHTASHSLESGSWNRIWCVYVYQFVCVYVSKLTAVQSLWMFQQAVSFYQSNSINVCKAELQLSDWMCVWRSLHAEFCVITRISVLFFLLLCLE